MLHTIIYKHQLMGQFCINPALLLPHYCMKSLSVPNVVFNYFESTFFNDCIFKCQSPCSRTVYVDSSMYIKIFLYM